MLVTPTASASAQNLTVAVAADKASDTAGNNNTAATDAVVSVAIGTSNADTLTGGTGADLMLGKDGADSISGGTGIDSIYGGAGADTIVGGAGADQIYLTETTAAVDVIKLSATTDSTTTAPDVITGFAAGDKIDISALLAAATGGAYTGENSVPAGASTSLLRLANATVGYDSDVGATIAKVDIYNNGATLSSEGSTLELYVSTNASVTEIGFTATKSDWLGGGNENTGLVGITGASAITSTGKIGSLSFTVPQGTTSFVFAITQASVNGTLLGDLPIPQLIGTSSTVVGGLYTFNDDGTTLGTVGDNEIRISQEADGTVQIRYDGNSTAGTTTASEIIQLEGITLATIDLTKTDFVF